MKFRRDLDALASQAIVRRAHGGGQCSKLVESNFLCRSRSAEGEKRPFAFAAAAHVEPRQAIVIGRFGGKRRANQETME
jgi:DeoR/GlpR family transcriptional regulator of sugar metabolism